MATKAKHAKPAFYAHEKTPQQKYMPEETKTISTYEWLQRPKHAKPAFYVHEETPQQKYILEETRSLSTYEWLQRPSMPSQRSMRMRKLHSISTFQQKPEPSVPMDGYNDQACQASVLCVEETPQQKHIPAKTRTLSTYEWLQRPSMPSQRSMCMRKLHSRSTF